MKEDNTRIFQMAGTPSKGKPTTFKTVIDSEGDLVLTANDIEILWIEAKSGKLNLYFVSPSEQEELNLTFSNNRIEVKK